MRTGSLPAMHAADARATAAALPQVTMPHSAPVSSANRLPAASISSSRLTNWRDAASTAARTRGNIRLPPCMVRTLQQLMKGRTPRAGYGLALLSVRSAMGCCLLHCAIHRRLELIEQLHHRRVGERQDLRHDDACHLLLRVEPVVGVEQPRPGDAAGTPATRNVLGIDQPGEAPFLRHTGEEFGII